MSKLVTSDVSNISGAETIAITTLNDNFAAVETAMENTLSRDGTTPNTMSADIDLNGNDLLNVGTIDVETITVNGDELTTELYSIGPTGPSGTISVGSVSTLTPGSSATVVNVGTSTAAVLNFGIPQGAAGAGTGDMLSTSNLSDVANTATAFSNIKQAASTSATGVVELSTDAEAQTGTDTARAITPANLTAKEASVAEWRANTADRILTTDIVNSAMAEVTLTDAATITWDMSTGIDFVVTLGGNRTLGNPSNTVVGRRGRIRVVQDGTGSRTLTKSSNCKTVGGAALTLSTPAASVDYIDYDVVSSTNIRLSLSKAWS